MKRYLVTPVFCKAKMLEGMFRNIYDRPTVEFPSDVLHVLVGGNYPVDREQNLKEIRRLAKQYGCLFMQTDEDLGLHENLNLVVKTLKISREDIFVQVDPDDRPIPGFMKPLTDLMCTNYAVVALSFKQIFDEHRDTPDDHYETFRFGYRVWMHKNVEMWKTAAYNMAFIESIGGFKEPNAFYGGLESYLYTKWKPRSMELVYLADVHCEAEPVDLTDPELVDLEYTQWKHAHAGGYVGSFEKYLDQMAKISNLSNSETH